MSKFLRQFGIGFFAEVAATWIAVGAAHTNTLIIPMFVGLNCAFIAFGLIVYDHEKRGRGE